MAEGKGASLLPQDWVSGGGVQDGDYTITKAVASMFDYGGKSSGEPVPSLLIGYKDESGIETEQHYSAGRAEFLVPSEDGKRFVHPSGEEAHLAKGSNAALWIKSMIDAGFPTAELTNDVSCFVTSKVTVKSVAQPRRPGVKDEKEGKTISLISAFRGKGAAKKAPAATAAGKGQAIGHAAAPPAKTAAAATSNGDLASTVALVIMEILGTKTEPVTVVKLSTDVMLRFSKLAGEQKNMAAAKKLAQDPAFLTAGMGTEQWMYDSEANTVSAYPAE